MTHAIGAAAQMTHAIGVALALALVCCTFSVHAGQPHQIVTTGLEVLANNGYSALKGHRVGIVSNPSGIFPNLEHEVNVMAATPGVNLVAIYGPEHGFRGDQQAGSSDAFYIDSQTGLPVFSIYGRSSAQIAAIFKNSTADLIVFDVQDTGVRYYTFIWCLYSVMVAAASINIPVIVLDRPNPLGGEVVSGAVLQPQFSSGVGMLPIPQRFGMTMGELAQLYNGQFMPASKCALTVIAMQGWQRSMSFDQTGLPWVPTSPNIPTLDSAFVYSGFGLIEGTNCSTGRGTTRPFELVGAPFMLNGTITRALNAQNVPGVAWRDVYYIPTFDRYTNLVVGGTQLYITNPSLFDPVRTAIVWMATAHKVYPKDFAWQAPSLQQHSYQPHSGLGDGRDPALSASVASASGSAAAVAVSNDARADAATEASKAAAVPRYWIDLMAGTDTLRKGIDAGLSADQIIAGWQSDLQAFMKIRAQYLLY